MGILRTDEYIAKIKLAKGDDEILKITTEEKRYLVSNYPIITSLKSAYTAYKKELKEHIKLRYKIDLNTKATSKIFELPQYQKFKNMDYLKIIKYITFESELLECSKMLNIEVEKLRRIKEFYIGKIFSCLGFTDNTPEDKKLKEQLRKNKEEYEAKITKREKEERINIYNYKNIVSKAVDLLDGSYIEKIVALILLTGRREAEIGATAKFEFMGNNKLMFSGQLKTKHLESKPYEIPVLCNPSKIIKALKEIREDKPKYNNNPDVFHDNNSRYISEKTKYHFKDSIKDCSKGKDLDVKAHDLRGLYATISFYELLKNNPEENITEHSYYSQILGHSEKEKGTTHSYFKFNVKT